MDIHKNSIAIRISREMALDHGLVEPTPEERERRERELRAFVESMYECRAEWETTIETMHKVAGPISQSILELHAVDLESQSPTCDGCDYDGYDSEPPPWPCRTVRLVGELLAVDLPAGDLPSVRYRHAG